MEKLNYINNYDLYESGTLAPLVGDLIYAPSFISEVIIENEHTLSDKHTLYYCYLIRTLKGPDTITVIINDYEEHSYLINQLQKLGVRVETSYREVINTVKKTKRAKKIFLTLRIEEEPKEKNIFKRLSKQFKKE